MRGPKLAIALLMFGAPAGAEFLRSATSPRDLPREKEMQVFVDEVLLMTGLQNDVTVVVDPTAPGCAYATTRTGKQYIGVDPACVGPLRTGGRYNHHAIGVLCHEIGHLLAGHTTSLESGHYQETEADEWAGWAMHRRGMSLEEAKTFYETLRPEASKSHPDRATRLRSIERGWNRAKLIPGYVQRELPTPPELSELREEHPTLNAPRAPEPVEKPQLKKETKRGAWSELLDTPLPWARGK